MLNVLPTMKWILNRLSRNRRRRRIVKEILKEKIKEKKALYESRVYDITSLNLPKCNYFCPKDYCENKVKLNGIKLYINLGYMELYCVNCFKDFMKEEIISEIKWEVIEILNDLYIEIEKGKEEEKGK